MSGFGQLRRFGCLLALGVAGTACDGCRRDHPFTPFVASSATGGAAAIPEDVRPHDAGASAISLMQGEKLAPNSRQFPLGPRQAEAPATMTVDSVLRADWNDDGNVDAIALMHAAAGETGPLGAVYFYDGASDARRLFDLPGWIPSSPDCAWDAQLSQVSKRTATVEVRMHCGGSMPPRSATRFLAVVSPYRPQPLIIGWRLADAAPNESFEARVKIGDRDGDNSDDITLALSLGLSSGNASVSGELTWLDRTAGLSRATGQLPASLESTLLSLEKKAQSRTSASDADSGAGLVWRLLASACAASGTPRVFSADGSPLSCDSLGPIASRLVAIEVRAALTQNDVLRAAFTLARARRAFGSPISASEQAHLVKSIGKACVHPKTLAALKTDFAPVSVRPSPHYSPLQFQSDGILDVITSKGVIRVKPDGHAAVDEDADAASLAPPSWPLAVVAADGRSWEGLIPSCDRSEISLLTKSAQGAFLAPSLTNLLAPRPGLCAGATKLNWHASPIRFDDGKAPVVIVEGACVTEDTRDSCLKPSRLGKPEPGSPRSPDGNWLVAATNIGLFVVGGPKPEIWDGPDIGNPESLKDCTVSNGGQQLACIRESRVWLFSKVSPDEPTSKP